MESPIVRNYTSESIKDNRFRVDSEVKLRHRVESDAVPVSTEVICPPLRIFKITQAVSICNIRYLAAE